MSLSVLPSMRSGGWHTVSQLSALPPAGSSPDRDSGSGLCTVCESTMHVTSPCPSHATVPVVCASSPDLLEISLHSWLKDYVSRSQRKIMQ